MIVPVPVLTFVTIIMCKLTTAVTEITMPPLLSSLVVVSLYLHIPLTFKEAKQGYFKIHLLNAADVLSNYLIARIRLI